MLHTGFLRRDMGPAKQGRSLLVCIENSIQARALGSTEKGKIEKQHLMQAQHVSTLPFVAPIALAEMRKLPTNEPFQTRLHTFSKSRFPSTASASDSCLVSNL